MSKKEMKPGEFCWNELMTSNVEESKEFYSSLFGWEIENHDMGHGKTYSLLKKDGEDVGGMMQIPQDKEKDMPPHWMSYILVNSVEEIVQKAKNLGANIKQQPMDIGDFGRLAVIQDPNGAHIAVWESLKSC